MPDMDIYMPVPAVPIGVDASGRTQYDRVIRADDFADGFLGALVSSGVIAIPGDALQLMADTGMQITLRPGNCVVGNRLGRNKTEKTITLDPADGELNRIDAVFCRYDRAGRKVEYVVKQSTPATNPVIPEIQNDADYKEIMVGYVTISKGATAVTQANITDTRMDSRVCGWVTGLIQQMDTSTLYNQLLAWSEEYKAGMEQDFSTWFETMKGQLSEDAAGNLQNQINSHAHTGADGTVKVDAASIEGMADQVAEQGTSGIWTYRKWASGIIECWGQTDIGAVGITNTTGSQYYSATQYLDYPSLANQVDHVSLSAYSDVTVYTLSEYWLANSKIAYRLMSGYQVTTPLATRLSAYVMGRWQNA